MPNQSRLRPLALGCSPSSGAFGGPSARPLPRTQGESPVSGWAAARWVSQRQRHRDVDDDLDLVMNSRPPTRRSATKPTSLYRAGSRIVSLPVARPVGSTWIS